MNLVIVLLEHDGVKQPWLEILVMLPAVTNLLYLACSAHKVHPVIFSDCPCLVLLFSSATPVAELAGHPPGPLHWQVYPKGEIEVIRNLPNDFVLWEVILLAIRLLGSGKLEGSHGIRVPSGGCYTSDLGQLMH